eukprot:TRINITY_DN94536_c0_g1_i1.p1 TRINITY_DN94536_c0_g1~~TRINITY_DN94536_c0_g1_i1.p1  ORF type:complete len:461 (+),score=82.49 TRINITY_DN94536_c0_g1_i1:118-1500(+)
MLPNQLCRCICGTSKYGEQFEKADWTPRAPITALPTELEEVEESPHEFPEVVGRLCYSMLADQQLRGVPIREGELWHLSTEEKVDPIHFVLHVNGFCFETDGQEMSISLSPFTLVRNCKFQSTYPTLNISDFKIFKVSLFAQGACYYFGVRGEDERQAEEERSRWVLDISRAMRLVTQSLFPPFLISCDPVEDIENTKGRLLAGYLVHFDDSFTASVLYCELHAQHEDRAKIVLYENDRCSDPVMDIYITERSICCEKIGINCSCFSVEDHQFSARTLSERKLWLRAISNLKVKLQNRAPSPSEEDMGYYRDAIKEHVTKMQVGTGQLQTDALLQRTCARAAPYKGMDSLGMLPEPPLSPTGPQLHGQEPLAAQDNSNGSSGTGANPEPPQELFAKAVSAEARSESSYPRDFPQPLRRSSSLSQVLAHKFAGGIEHQVSHPKRSWSVATAPKEVRQPGDG